MATTRKTFSRSSFQIQWTGLDRLVRATQVGPINTAPYGRDLYQKIAIELLAFWHRRFQILSSGGSVDGDKWDPLTFKTLMKKSRSSKVRDAERIMVALGHLMKALNPKGHPRGQLIKIGPDGLKVGFSNARHPKGYSSSRTITYAELADHMQKGDLKKNRPPRPILVLPDEITGKRIIRHIKNAIERTGDMRGGHIKFMPN